MELAFALGSVEFASPFMLLAAVPLLVILAWGLLGITKRGRQKRKERGAVSAAALQDLPVHPINLGGRANKLRMISLVIIILLSAVVAAGPYFESRRATSTVERVEHMSTVVTVFDISGSMRGKSLSDKSRFDVGRDTLVYFLEEQKKRMANRSRMGLIFYSSEPFQYRRPTQDLDSLIGDLNRLDLQFARNAPMGTSQLSQLVGGTETPPALFMAGRVLQELDLEGGDAESFSVILVIDIHERRAPLYEAIEILTRAGIKVYVLSVTRDYAGGLAKSFRRHFSNNIRVKYFDISDGNRSTKPLKEAAAIISEFEAAQILVQETRSAPYSANTEFLALFYAVILLFVVLSERYWRRTRGGAGHV